MEPQRVQEYYDMIRYYYLKPDSDWTDKSKSIRTVAHDFYSEITRTNGTFADALKEFYKWSKYSEVSNAAFSLKDRLNDVVHQNKQVDRETFITYYSMLVRLIYLATGVLPDALPMEYIGCAASDELDGLNDEQKEAVLCDAHIVYVSAGPGTGKTHLLINKLLHTISSSTTPEKIVALSYTNTASFELGEKFRKAAFETRLQKDYEFYNGTLHSFCYKMMKSYYTKAGKDFNYIIIDDTDIEDLAEEFRIQFNDQYTKEDIKKCLKSRLLSTDPKLRELIAEMKAKYNIISIDDILTNFIGELSDSAFVEWFKGQVTVLVIDEAQDLTELNYRIFDLLIQVNPNMKLFLVGDPRQNIFGFNGGSYEHLHAFLGKHSDYVGKNLTGTYRCPQPVCDYVNTFRFTDCPNTPLRSVGGTTGRITVKDAPGVSEEASEVLSIVKGIADINNTAILCQNLKYLAPLIEILGQEKIPYKVFGGQKLVKKHIKRFNHLLRIVESDNEYSINAIGRAFLLQLDRMPGRNVTERFYNTSAGRIIRDIKEDIERKTAEMEEVSLKALAATIIREFFPNVEHAVSEDLEALKEMMGQYSSIADFMLSFAIDREAFAQFIEKNYVECQVPVTDKFLTLSTIHSAKGLEWKNVIIMGLSEGNFPNMWFARDMDEEGKAAFLNDLLKSMFVAATRTSGNLYLTYSRQNAWGYSQMPSRFLRGAK